MKVFVTGGSGYIGVAVIAALRHAGHETLALARSEQSAKRLAALGSQPLIGDMRRPDTWAKQLRHIDGVIHLAATFGADMADADAALVHGLGDWLSRQRPAGGAQLPFVYTGGVWLYGPVGDDTAVEGTRFEPPAEFAFMVEQRAWLFAATRLAARVVHPALVWDESGGVIGDFLSASQNGDPPRLCGGASVRWPLVHRDDLARLYVLALERGEPGADYHGVAEPGVRVADIAGAIARCCGAPEPVSVPVAEVVRDKGSWAACEAFDQTMAAPATRMALGWKPSALPILDYFCV
jgi:nucleoside-diphosphate-sugar epimerase